MAGVAGIGGVLAWLVNTLASALLGLVVGAIIVAVLHVIPRRYEPTSKRATRQPGLTGTDRH